MAAERNFWQVLIIASKNETGLHTRVIEYPSLELAEETITAIKQANEKLTYTYVGAVRLYPHE